MQLSERMPRARLFVGLLAAVTLVACGGSGGGGSAFEGPEDDQPGSSDGGLMPEGAGEPGDRPDDMDGSGETDGGETPTTPDDSCSIAAQNNWVYESMLDYYLFYDQVPVVDPTTFAGPSDLLRAIRYEERDPFSFIRDAGESDLESVEGREFGLGYNWGSDDEGLARITRVIADSPFARVGIERGDVIVSVNGVPASTALEGDNNLWDVFTGTPDSPGRADWIFRKRDTDEQVSFSITASEYAIDTVRRASTFTNNSYDGVTGYLLFTRFLETSETELSATFAEFRSRNVTDLVLDLRYNRGGRVSIAQQLASLLIGDDQRGALLQEYRFNDKYAASNYELRVRDELRGLGLRSLVVLVSSQTASASELIINSLRPLMNVTVIGNAVTSGKPYIQRGRDRCDQRLNAIEAETFNSVGESVFGGIRPDCFAEDNWSLDFGRNPDTNEIEDGLLAGLDRVVFGTCEPFASTPAKRRAVSVESPYGQGSMAQGGAFY